MRAAPYRPVLTGGKRPVGARMGRLNAAVSPAEREQTGGAANIAAVRSHRTRSGGASSAEQRLLLDDLGASLRVGKGRGNVETCGFTPTDRGCAAALGGPRSRRAATRLPRAERHHRRRGNHNGSRRDHDRMAIVVTVRRNHHTPGEGKAGDREHNESVHLRFSARVPTPINAGAISWMTLRRGPPGAARVHPPI